MSADLSLWSLGCCVVVLCKKKYKVVDKAAGTAGACSGLLLALRQPLLLRLVMSFTLVLYSPVSSLVTTANPTAPLTNGRKIYRLGGPTPTLTASSNFHFIDNRSADPNLVGVRQLEFVEILEIWPPRPATHHRRVSRSRSPALGRPRSNVQRRAADWYRARFDGNPERLFGPR